MRRVTIADVARRAGVSPTAVSFAFNRPSQLSTLTMERILAAARELGYAPSPFARALMSQQRAGVIGVLVPQPISAIFGNPFFATFLEGVGAICHDQELGMLLVGAYDDGSLTEAIARAPVDGFIVVGLDERHHEVEPLRRRGVPFVIVDGQADTASSLNIEDEAGAHAAMAHLVGHGHRDVLCLTFETPYAHLDDVYHGVGGARLRGFQRAAEEHGLAWRDDRLIPSISSILGGEQSFEQAWSSGMRPTAVVAVGDAMAIGAVRAAERLGLRVPHDVEIIGFDDVPLASLVRPGLSTVRQPVLERGRLAAELLVGELQGGPSGEAIRLPTELVLRETTRTLGTRASANEPRQSDKRGAGYTWQP